jgi:glycosyltransferase involved in cell wall biosynthesis
MEYIQILTPLIEVIHHPITMDLKYELSTSNNLIYRFSRHRWYSFLRMQKKVAPLLKNILTPSNNSKKDISKEFHVKPENISVIHNAVDSNIFRPYPEIKNLPQRLITTASADVPLKGLDFSLYALADLSKEFQDIELLVIGTLRKGGHTDRLIKKLNLNERVTFKTGITKDEIAQEYAKSSVAIVSSLYEGFGYPVAEAMSCSIPLIATDVASIPEITDNFAILIPPKDSDAIRDSIRKILLEPDLYNKVAAKGRLHIKNKFNWQTIGKQYEELMNKVIKNHTTIIKGNNANL